MKYKNILLTAVMAMLWVGTASAQTVSILENDRPVVIEKEQTQTQISPGWKIVDLQLPSKVKRYLWNPHAKDVSVSDGRRPRLVVTTDTLLLADMVIIKLKTRAEYRLIPKPDIHDCQKLFCDINNFSIEPYEKSANTGVDAFLVQPLRDLDPGEYIITWFTGPTVGEYKDWMVWPLTIR